MGLFYRHIIDENTKLAIWKIEEDEMFFLSQVPVKRDISHPQKQLQHLAGRFLLPYLFEDFPNREIAIADTHCPYLPGEQYHFSISHCGDFAAAIVSRNQRVGIDIELYSEKIWKVRNKFLSPEEQLLPLENGKNNLSRMTALWSAKEAIYKWWSYGEIGLKGNIHLLQWQEMYIKAELDVAQQRFPLNIAYKLFDNMSLCWLADNQCAFSTRNIPKR